MPNRVSLIHKLSLTAVAAIFSLLFSALTPTPAQVMSPAGVNSPVNSKITLDLKGIDVVEALKIISTQGNMDLVIGENIKGRVTLFLKDVDIYEAFNIILLSNDLAYDKRGDILYVMTQKDYEQIYGERFGNNKDVKTITLKYAKASEAAKILNQTKTAVGKVLVDDLSNSIILVDTTQALEKMSAMIAQIDKPTVTKIMELHYAKAKDIHEKVKEMISAEGSVYMDERSNTLVITDSAARMLQLSAVIDSFDVKPRQVLIDAKIVEVTLTDSYKLGVDWEALFRALGKQFTFTNKFELEPQQTSLAALPGTGSGLEVNIGSFGTNYAMLIQALKSVGDVNTLSSPRITCLNNQEAKILVGKNRPYAVNSVIQGSTSPTTTASQINFIEIGVKLYVTPTINQDGFITMKIKPEVSASTENYTYNIGTDVEATVPIVQTTQADTSITVKDGRTIIIAGLITDVRDNLTKKVPYAGDVPLFGHLFKKSIKSIQKAELVIFLTPHIITGGDDVREVPEAKVPEEKSFTMPEDYTFERRRRINSNPGMFEESATNASKIEDPKNYQRMSVPNSVEEYYYLVKNRILENIRLAKSKGKKISGKVEITFSLTPDGQLATQPAVREMTNKAFEQCALEAVKKAAPFPAFPEAMTQRERQFNIELVFE